jgi:hypothetical protein
MIFDKTIALTFNNTPEKTKERHVLPFSSGALNDPYR